MRMTLFLPIMNNLRFVMPMLGCLKYNTSEDTEWLVFDNGSNEPIEKYIRNYIRPKRLNFVRYETNQGLVKNNQEAYKQCETDVLCLLHTDCFIYEKDWDKRILSYFETIPKLGIAGFFGAQGCLPNGGRLQDVEQAGQMSGLSNMLEAEIHGIRLREDQPWRACAIFDSFMMACSMEMLRAGGGFDMRYKYHHGYDRDTSLESIRRGYKNIVVNVPNHHIGGMTHETVQYQDWLEKEIGQRFENGVLHNTNMTQFEQKWKELDALPLYINDDFSFRTGAVGVIPNLEYRGNAIVGASK